MKITPIAHGLDLLKSDTERSVGLHASDIYGRLYQSLEPKRYKDTEGDSLRMSMGLAWEQYLEAVMLRNGHNVSRPGSLMSRYGFEYSPDGIIVNGKERVAEYKLTWMSASETLDDPKFDKWHTQVKLYAAQLEIPRAEFWVNFVNGDYKKNRDPDLRVYQVEYSKRELAENETMLLRFAQHEGML